MPRRKHQKEKTPHSINSLLTNPAFSFSVSLKASQMVPLSKEASLDTLNSVFYL